MIIFLIGVITFAGVGDIMMGNCNGGILPKNEGRELFINCKPFFENIDIVFGNLEGPITDWTIPTKIEDKKTKFAFRMPKILAKNLKDAGFNVLSIVNNHTMDFGIKGYEDTKKVLDEIGIKYASFEEIATFEIRGIKICITAYSFSGKKSIIEINEAMKEINSLSRTYDIVIVSVHGGKEGANATKTKNEMEYFLGEKRGNLILFSRSAIDNGADLVVIHGPHVPRALEIYKDRLIAYSLGNFCTYAGINVSGIQGLAPLLLVNMNDDGTLISGRIISFKQEYCVPPYIDNEKGALNLIKKLSYEDFSETSPLFEDDCFRKKE